MQRYYFFYRTYKDYNGQHHGYWSSRLANTKKEITDFYNPRGRQYFNHVVKVYSEKQAKQLARADSNLLTLIKQHEES